MACLPGQSSMRRFAQTHVRSVVQAGTTVQVHEVLGRGASGTVLKATLTPSQPVAIKRANRYRARVGEEEEEAARRDRVAQQNVDYEARMLAMFKVHTIQAVLCTWGESPDC